MRLIFPTKSINMLGGNLTELTFIVSMTLDFTNNDLDKADKAYSKLNDYFTDFVLHKAGPIVSSNYTNMGLLVKDIYQRLNVDFPIPLLKELSISNIQMEFNHPNLHIVVPA